MRTLLVVSAPCACGPWMGRPAMEKLEVFQGPRLAWLSRGRSPAPSSTASRGPLLADAAGEVI